MVAAEQPGEGVKRGSGRYNSVPQDTGADRNHTVIFHNCHPSSNPGNTNVPMRPPPSPLLFSQGIAGKTMRFSEGRLPGMSRPDSWLSQEGVARVQKDRQRTTRLFPHQNRKHSRVKTAKDSRIPHPSIKTPYTKTLME